MTQQNSDPMDFAAGGESRDSGEMWPNGKSEIGDAILGKVVAVRRVGTGEKAYDVATFSPVVVRERGKGTGYAAVSISISATLKKRISEKDEGTVLSVAYKGKEKGTGQQPYKLFDVHSHEVTKLQDALKHVNAPAEMIEALGLPF